MRSLPVIEQFLHNFEFFCSFILVSDSFSKTFYHFVGVVTKRTFLPDAENKWQKTLKGIDKSGLLMG